MESLACNVSTFFSDSTGMAGKMAALKPSSDLQQKGGKIERINEHGMFKPTN